MTKTFCIDSGANIMLRPLLRATNQTKQPSVIKTQKGNPYARSSATWRRNPCRHPPMPDKNQNRLYLTPRLPLHYSTTIVPPTKHLNIKDQSHQKLKLQLYCWVEVLGCCIRLPRHSFAKSTTKQHHCVIPI